MVRLASSNESIMPYVAEPPIARVFDQGRLKRLAHQLRLRQIPNPATSFFQARNTGSDNHQE